MGKLIEIDARYKVDDDIVEEFKEWIEHGDSIRQIAIAYGVSSNTVSYWTDKEFREKQKLKNAKRRKTGEELKKSIQRDREKMKLRWQHSPNSRQLHCLHSARAETRSNRITVHGEPIEKLYARREELHTPNSKIKIK